MEGIAIAQLVEYLPSWAIVALVFVGSLHLVLPPVQKAVEAVVTATSTKKDDEIYKEVVSSKYYVYFCKGVEYLFGLKLQKKK